MDEFKPTEDTIQLNNSDSENDEDENMSSDVPNILINEIVSPVIEQSKEIGTPSSKNCTVSLETVDKLFENYKENTGGPHVEIVSIESTLERENEREEKCLPLIKMTREKIAIIFLLYWKDMVAQRKKTKMMHLSQMPRKELRIIFLLYQSKKKGMVSKK